MLNRNSAHLIVLMTFCRQHYFYLLFTVQLIFFRNLYYLKTPL
ncbi:hypothetical protein FM106_03020 [Brachybacterium faecium]|nr:hypothetical protein FM106_03020 [Brachybacterium faecium]